MCKRSINKIICVNEINNNKEKNLKYYIKLNEYIDSITVSGYLTSFFIQLDEKENYKIFLRVLRDVVAHKYFMIFYYDFTVGKCMCVKDVKIVEIE